MAELDPQFHKEFIQSQARNSDFHKRVLAFKQEFVVTITPNTDPKKLLSVVTALGSLLYNYANAPFGHDVDPSTISDTCDEIATDALMRYVGLADLPGTEMDAIIDESADMVGRYFGGFPTHSNEQPINPPNSNQG